MTTRTQAAAKPTLATTITTEVAKRVVGQEVMVERLLIGLLTGGHILLEGVPGLAKTLAVRTVAECLHIAYSRIQFTPDLLARARCSPTSSSPTKSTARRPRCSRRCSKRCRRSR